MGCGNGFLEAGEVCDDGNTSGGDTCSATCHSSGSYALQFDGVDDSVMFEPSDEFMLDGDFTLEAWYRDDGIAVGSLPIVSEGYIYPYYWLGIRDGDLIGGYFNGMLPIELETPSPADGDWHHAALTYDGALLELWLDGESLDTESTAIPPSPVLGPLTVGTNNHEFEEYFFEGAIDEVRISSVPRYTATFTPARRQGADSDTVLLLHFDEGSGIATRAETPDVVAGAVNGAVWIPE